MDLLDRLAYLARVRLGHRLHNNGGIATNREPADLDGARLAARRKIFGVAEIHEVVPCKLSAFSYQLSASSSLVHALDTRQPAIHYS
jgi:hypothetical protein